MSESLAFDHDLINEGLDLFRDFAVTIERSGAIERLDPLEERYRSGLYRLVLVGEEKRGKSSLVSALLGTPELLPAGPEPMTACVFKVIYGEKMQHRIFFLPADPDDPEGSRPAPLDVLPDQVVEYGSEGRNPDNIKRVDFIAVEHPHPLLKAGLAIVDLPGLGGLKREHGILTLSYLPNADAAFFVLDSTTSALTREEKSTLVMLRKFTNHVVFVQTKTDAASELQWQSWRDRNLEEIERLLEVKRDEVSYFPVSSKLKIDFDLGGDPEDLQDSGFLPLVTMLENELIPSKYDRLAVPMLSTLICELADVSQSIEDEITILSTESEAKLKEMEDQIRVGQREFDVWKNETWPRVLSHFRQEYRDAVIAAQTTINAELDPSPFGPIVGGLMLEIEHQDLSAADIEASSGSFNDNAVAECGQRLDLIGRHFEDSTMSAYSRAAEQVGEATMGVLIERPRAGVAPTTVGHRMATRSGLWATAMQGRMGFMMGSMAGGVVASFLFPPLGLAALAATALGGLFGASRSILESRKRERDAALIQLRGLLSDTVRRMGQRSMMDFNASAGRNENAMIDALQSAVDQRRDDVQSALNAVVERRQITREQTHQRLRLLKGHLAAASAIMDTLRKAGVPIADQPAGVAA